MLKETLFLTLSWAFFEPKSHHWLEARVPGCIYTDLFRHKLIPDPFWGSNEKKLQWIEERDWEYRCRFVVEPEFCSYEHIDLVAEGLDTVTNIHLNEEKIGSTDNMFLEYRFDVKQVIRAGGNVLNIGFSSPINYIRARQERGDFAEAHDPLGGRAHIRKAQYSFGWDWAPRFAGCGVYKPVRLEAWQENRFENVRIRQQHEAGRVTAVVHAELAGKSGAIRGKVCHCGELIAEISELEFEIANPKLWWPNAHGDQPLYEVSLDLVDEGEVLDQWSGRIGLRTIDLDRHLDDFGESFQFVVNGRPIFAKGTNWIPAHCFVAEVSRAEYANLLTSCAQANMNMVRVWGGGIYEMEDFYDLCDEKGLLVWQDFMFACAIYPGHPKFLDSVRAEAEYQVKRLANRACLALWCGNNEIECRPRQILKSRQRKEGYEKIFYQLLDEVVAHYDGETAYWPSSPHNPEGFERGVNNERAGDCHFWDVWHGKQSVKNYEKRGFRFYSEFGMQSFSSPEIAATFCVPEEWNAFGKAMENHQKNRAGNLIIKEYVARRYRLASDYPSLAYLSQLNQAYCMKVAVEHFRRFMPRTMGALYWQLNDCWPVFSWSSLEFGGRWKALHFAAKRFFAPILVSAHIAGDEWMGLGHVWRNNIREIHLYTVCDAPGKANGRLSWTLFHFDGRQLEAGEKSVFLGYGQSHRQKTLDLSRNIKAFGAGNIYLRIRLATDEAAISEDTIFLTAPRLIDFPRAPISISVERLSKREFQVGLHSDAFQHSVQVDLPRIAHGFEDNFFDLYPGETRKVRLRTEKPAILAEIKRTLTLRSLTNTY